MTIPFDITKINNQLSLALQFINTYTRDTFPLFCSTKYLAPNAFHRVAGRQDYFDTQCGTSEAATILAVASLQASIALNSSAWRTLGLNFLNAFANYFYLDNVYTTQINQTNPRNTPLVRNHWLIITYESIVSEGLQSGNDPFNFGYFETLNFTNGIGKLPIDTSKVYRVYVGELSYKNVYAPLKSGVDYPINYYVRNGNRIFTNGNPNQPTSETNGTVVLQSNISGSFQIIYVRRDSTVVNPPNNVRSGEGLIEPYPLIYPCKTAGREFTGFAADTAWWAYDAFKLAFDITGNTQYNNAAEVTKWNTIKYLVENQKESYFYKKEPATEPLRYPGSYLVQTNSSNNVTIPSSGYTANRETTGALTNYLKLNVNAVSANQFPTMELQNYVTQVLFDYLVNVYIESSINTTALIEVKLSLSTNSNDFSQEWKAYWLLNGNGTSQNITFDYLAFFKPKPTTIWFTGIAQTPVYVYNTASWIYVQDNINGINSCITQITITDSTGGSGLINFTPTNKIPNIVYSLFGNCRVRFKDSTNTFWYVNLVATGKYSTFSGSWQSLFNVADRDITEIVFENTSDTTCVLKLFIVGELPDTLPVPCTIYKASVVCKLQTNYSWWIGDFKPNNNSLDKLPYTPGSIGFTLNTLNNVIQSFGRSQFYMAYQSPYSLSRWGFKEYAKNVVKLFNDSQESYINQSINRINGLLHQVFLPYDVENIPFLDRTQVVKSVLGTGVPFLFNRYVEYQTDTYEFNKFSWKGLDPNTQWSPYCFRAMEDLARYYYENTNDSLARKILTNFVKFIDKWNIDNNNSAITNIIPNNDPQALYFEPHLKAIEGLIMLYCNISGLETEITWKGIKNAFDYIDNQFVATGNMTGCWCKNQPTFTSGGQQYQEFFSFWQGKIIEFYSLCLINQNKIIQPNISTLPVFPLDFCNSPAHFIVNIKEPEFPIKYKNFRTGDSQKIILNDVPIGRLVSLRYEKLSESLTEQIITFYENCSLNFDGYFTFPSNYSYNDLNGKWIFIEEPKIKTFLGNSRKALFDIEIIVERN